MTNQPHASLGVNSKTQGIYSFSLKSVMLSIELQNLVGSNRKKGYGTPNKNRCVCIYHYIYTYTYV